MLLFVNLFLITFYVFGYPVPVMGSDLMRGTLPHLLKLFNMVFWSFFTTSDSRKNCAPYIPSKNSCYVLFFCPSWHGGTLHIFLFFRMCRPSMVPAEPARLLFPFSYLCPFLAIPVRMPGRYAPAAFRGFYACHFQESNLNGFSCAPELPFHFQRMPEASPIGGPGR